MDERKMRACLEQALLRLEDPTALIGRSVPDWAVRWAMSRGLDVRVSNLVPPGQLFIVGATPVPGIAL